MVFCISRIFLLGFFLINYVLASEGAAIDPDSDDLPPLGPPPPLVRQIAYYNWESSRQQTPSEEYDVDDQEEAEEKTVPTSPSDNGQEIQKEKE